jgi:Niemann-Pick C1 protein
VGTIGLIGILMALISGLGISSIFGYTFSNTLITIPFLVVGLGVDDIFVIMGTLRKIRSEHQQLPLAEIIARTVHHSGTSITITSATNIVVMLVGMTTYIPSMCSYYFTASICIFMTYFYVVTFFVAIVTLDERRITHNTSKKVEALPSQEVGKVISWFR